MTISAFSIEQEIQFYMKHNLERRPLETKQSKRTKKRIKDASFLKSLLKKMNE